MEHFIATHAMAILGFLMLAGGGLLFGNINQVYTGTPTSRRQPIACPSTVKSGDAVLIGSVPAVALDDYQSNIGGTTFEFGGSFNLTVVGQSGSPLTGHAVKPGDKVYAEGGSYDAATNFTTGFTLNGDSTNGTFFGYLDPSSAAVTSGVTLTSAVVLLPQGM
jgi:predicted RecA/RadA family phage recombinase